MKVARRDSKFSTQLGNSSQSLLFRLDQGTPQNNAVIAIGKDKLYAMLLDADDVPYLVAFRIVRQQPNMDAISTETLRV